MATKSSPEKLAYQKKRNAEPLQVKRREENNAARAKLMREGKVKKGDGKDVAHITALANGGDNAPGNLKAESEKKNRGWRRGENSYRVPKDV